MSFADVRLAFEVATIFLSAVIAAMIVHRYFSKRKPHLLHWSAAWTVVGVRVLVGVLLTPLSASEAFIYNGLTIFHDLLWFVGIAILMGLKHNGKFVFPMGFLGMDLIVDGFLLFGMHDPVASSAWTTLVAHPALLFILFGAALQEEIDTTYQKKDGYHHTDGTEDTK